MSGKKSTVEENSYTADSGVHSIAQTPNPPPGEDQPNLGNGASNAIMYDDMGIPETGEDQSTPVFLIGESTGSLSSRSNELVEARSQISDLEAAVAKKNSVNKGLEVKLQEVTEKCSLTEYKLKQTENKLKQTETEFEEYTENKDSEIAELKIKNEELKSELALQEVVKPK